MTAARFVGVGVGVYDEGHARLDHAVPDVEAFAELLDGNFGCTLLPNPAEQAARAALRALRGSMPEGGSLVLLWSGHAILSPAGGLRLLARDSGRYQTDGLGAASDVAAPCAESGATQLLLIVDTCFSGAAASAGDVAARLLQQAAPEGEHVWVGVLTSSLSAETARDGFFGQRLLKILKSGPETPELRVRWSPHSVLIRGDDLCDAVLKDWGSAAQSPDFLSRGSAWWMFPNPLYNPGAPERVVEHLLLAARGGARQDERSWFTGRAVEVDQVVTWVRSGQLGLHVVTGPAGTGKTAIVGRVVSLSNREERQRLLAEGRPLGHADPGQGSISAHVHARGLTVDRAADIIADQLVRAGVLVAQEARRNAAELVGQVQRAAETGGVHPVVVIDGLDEARGQAFAIAEDLAVRLAQHAVVIVSTRELRRSGTEPSLLDILTAGTAELDLDDPTARERGRSDLRDYIARRLAGVDPQMDGNEVARYLSEEAPVTGDRPFLLARLVTDQMRAAPVNTSLPAWQEQVSHSIEEAFDQDISRVGASGPGEMPGGRPAGESARALLSALAWGLGAGLPEEEWLACAHVATAGGGAFDRDDVTWVLDGLGRYIIQDGEAGVAVYRIAHQSLADYIRPPFTASHEQPFDPQAQLIATALLARYETLLAGGVPAAAPGYLWRYAWRHAAAAGPAGLELLRRLAAGEPALLPDVAMAALEVADRLAYWGFLQEAVGPSEEAVRRYRDLAAANPAFLPDLAAALNNLGVRYSEVGRRQEAVGPAEEAVRLRRDLAAANPAFLPDLASALNNLGVLYSEVGRRQEAVGPAEEAVRRYRDLAAANPAFLPNLASALGNLGNRYSQVGRRQEAVGPAEEAVRRYRDLADADPAFLPDLAGALGNLGNRYSEVGASHRADAAWEEAITGVEPSAAAFLHVARASNAQAGHRHAATWLARALAVDIDDRGLLAAAHEQARRHRSPDPVSFDMNWGRHIDGPVPAWLIVDPTLLTTARAWVETDTYAAERDRLAAHPELLGSEADAAVAEALLAVSEKTASRYTDLRQNAKREGVQRAYQPLLMAVLVHEFATADPASQHAMLADRRDELLDDAVSGLLRNLAAQNDDTSLAAVRAGALLDLARTGDPEPVFEALAEPGRFPVVLHILAIRPDPSSLMPAATVASTTAATEAEMASALFYLGAGTAIGGDQDRALGLITEARNLDPTQSGAWINELAEIGQQHHGVLQLIPALTAPSGSAQTNSPEETADDSD